jgi:hypothetical protein
MNIADALSGSAGLEGIQRMLLSGSPHQALRRELSALLAAPNILGPCQLRRARFKPGRKLMAYYDAHVHIEGDGRHSIRPIFVTWCSFRDGEKYHTPADLTAIEGEAVRRGLLAPFRKLAADTQELRMHVRVSPLDERFPQLVRVCDPEYVRDTMASICATSGEAVSASGYSITFIRYRPGQRHVLRYDPLDEPQRGSIFAKLYYTKEDGERALSLAENIRGWLAEYGEGVTCLRPLGYSADDAMVLYAQVLGTPLSECLRHAGQSLASLLKGTGAALFALHNLTPALRGPLELRDFTAEVKEIARTSEHVSALLPQVGATLKAVLERAQELYEFLPQEPPAFSHGDFKAEHVWVTPEGLTLIDLDSCHLGDPALDIGKFLADLRSWSVFYTADELRQAQEQFLAGYGPGASAERIVRARLYEAIELIKMTVRRVRMSEGGWARRTERLINCAQALLDDLQLSFGLPKK